MCGERRERAGRLWAMSGTWRWRVDAAVAAAAASMRRVEDRRYRVKAEVRRCIMVGSVGCVCVSGADRERVCVARGGAEQREPTQNGDCEQQVCHKRMKLLLAQIRLLRSTTRCAAPIHREQRLLTMTARTRIQCFNQHELRPLKFNDPLLPKQGS